MGTGGVLGPARAPQTWGATQAKYTPPNDRAARSDQPREVPDLDSSSSAPDVQDTRIKLPAPRSTAKGSAVSPEGLYVPRVTTQARINELARDVVERLRDGDTRGALDRIHGQRLPEDENFEGRFLAAFAVHAKSDGPGAALLLRHFSTEQRALFEAYLKNPDGRSRPEDIAFISVHGRGSGIRPITDIYADLRNRYPDPKEYQAAVADMERRYLETYGKLRGNPASLDADLTDKSNGELGDTDSARYRAARSDAPDALALHEARGDERLDPLLANVGRIDEFAAEYGYVADGKPGQGRERLEKLIDDKLHTSTQIARARALIAPGQTPQQRAGRYLELTLEAYLTNRSASREDVMRAMRAVSDPKLGIAGAEFDKYVSADVRRRVLADKRTDPDVTAAIGELSAGQTTGRGDALVADFDRQLGDARVGGRIAARQFGRWLDHLSDEQRSELQGAVPDLEDKIRALHLPPAMHERLLAGAKGTLDAVDLLHQTSRGLADGGEAVMRVQALDRDNRLAFKDTYEQRHGPGSFEKALDKLSDEEKRAVRLALTVPKSANRRDLDSLGAELKSVFGDTRGDSAWARASRWVTDKFSFSGDVADDAMREVTAAVRTAAEAKERGELSRDHVMAILHAQQRLKLTLDAYTKDRKDVADTTSDIATCVVGVLTLGAGLTVGAMTRAAVVTGSVNTAAQAVVTGPEYSAGQAAYDFFGGAALDLFGFGVMQAGSAGVRAAWRTLRRSA